MKKQLLPVGLLILLLTFIPPKNLLAQCNCNQPDPFNYSSTSCGLTNASISGPGLPGSSAVCSAGTSCSSGSTSYGYILSFSGTVTGYAWRVTGGWANREIVSGFIDRQTCTINGGVSGQFGTPGGFNSATLYIRWNSAATDRRIEVWGYTNVCNGFPCTLSYFKCEAVTVSSVPAAPTAITISSPNSFGTCGWKVASSYVSNATSYTWSGAAFGTFPTIVGPVVAENQTAFLCVRTNNACGSSANYCANVVIPNNTSCGSITRADVPNNENETVNGLPGNEIIVYPVPATNNLTVYLGNKEVIFVELYSLAGQLVEKTIPGGNNRLEINISRFNKGLYLVVVKQKNGTIFNKKVLLQ